MRRMRRGALLVLVLASCAAPARVASQALTTWDGIYTPGQALRGGGLYQERCSSCHGPQLGGLDAAPALAGGTFFANWSGVTLAVLADRVRVSMPQDDPGSLSRQQVADVLAYLFSRNGFPAGTRELPRRAGALGTMVFQARRAGG